MFFSDFLSDDDGTFIGIFSVWPEAKKIDELFCQFVSNHGKVDRLTSNSRMRIMNAAFDYVKCKASAEWHAAEYLDSVGINKALVITQTALSIDPQSKAIKNKRRDLQAIIDHIDELDRLFAGTSAGREIACESAYHRLPAAFEAVWIIRKAAIEALSSLTPPAQGRTPSPERQGRITLIANLMHEAFQAGAYPGTGQTGPFAELVGEAYKALKVGEERNLSRDLRDAANLLRQKGDSG
jgi:hypothetical protein